MFPGVQGYKAELFLFWLIDSFRYSMFDTVRQYTLNSELSLNQIHIYVTCSLHEQLKAVTVVILSRNLHHWSAPASLFVLSLSRS